MKALAVNTSLAVLILSCDKYSDLWAPFVKQARRCIPIDGYRVYLGSNNQPCREPGVIPVLSGDDVDWSTSYKRILAQIPERKLLVMTEDLFPPGPADEPCFRETVDFLFAQDAKHIKYWATPALDGMVPGSANLGFYDRGAPYRATVCGFWDREYLMKMLLEGESPWNFEIMGSYRTSYSDGFYGVKKSIFGFVNLIEKGQWLPQSLEWARHEGIEVQVDRRHVSRGGRQLLSRIKMAYFAAMLRVPWRWRLRMMEKLRKGLISY